MRRQASTGFILAPLGHAGEVVTLGQYGRPPGPRRPYVLPLESIRPVIRMAGEFDGGMVVPERYIYDFQIVLITRGVAEVRFEADSYRLNTHELVLLRPFELHSFSPAATPIRHLAIHFDLAQGVPPHDGGTEERSPYSVNLPGDDRLPTVIDPGAELVARLRRVVDHWRIGSSLDRLWARAELECVLATLIDSCRRQPSSDQPVRTPSMIRNRALIEQALALMRSDLSRGLTVSELAASVDMSPTHFNRVFRQVTGLSPMEHLRGLRVQRARELLVETRLSIKEIARRTGFEDAAMFSRTFRRVDGLTPSAYRDMLLVRGEPQNVAGEGADRGESGAGRT